MSGIVNLKTVGLDTNVFIYHFENNPDFAPFTRKIFSLMWDGTLKASTSVISIIETLSFPAPDGVVKNLREAFGTIPNLRVVDIDQAVAVEAAKIRRKYKFRLPDSVQLATARISHAEAFITNDQRLKSFKSLRVIILNQIKEQNETLRIY